MQDPVRQSMLARMGIQSWQLRRPALLGAEPVSDCVENSTKSSRKVPAISTQPPTGKLWLIAPRLPATALLTDICQLLGIAPEEVSLLSELPVAAQPSAGTQPLLWLTTADPHWPNALICPLAPNGMQKRALWQQLRQHLAAASTDI